MRITYSELEAKALDVIFDCLWQYRYYKEATITSDGLTSVVRSRIPELDVEEISHEGIEQMMVGPILEYFVEMRGGHYFLNEKNSDELMAYRRSRYTSMIDLETEIWEDHRWIIGRVKVRG
jgi:hypothetical protein